MTFGLIQMSVQYNSIFEIVINSLSIPMLCLPPKTYLARFHHSGRNFDTRPLQQCRGISGELRIGVQFSALPILHDQQST